MTSASSKLIVFPGQETFTHAPATIQQSLVDAASPSGAFLLSQCSVAFLHDIQSLPAVELHKLQIDPNDFSGSSDAILTVHHGRRFEYDCNPVLAGLSLFLIQSLRYLAHVESTYGTYTILPSATSVGFSSGSLPAAVVACSRTATEYVTHSIAAFRISLWIGIRVALAAADALDTHILEDPFRDKPWSAIIVGLSEASATELMKRHRYEKLRITDVQNDSSITVSGHLGILQDFIASLDPSAVVVSTSVQGFYHTPANASIRDQVIEDLEKRTICLPLTTKLAYPLWCTSSSSLMISAAVVNLAELVVETILLRPALWDDLTNHLADSSKTTEILNFGPGLGLCRDIHEILQEHSVASCITILEGSHVMPKEEHRDDAVAIVGMAINMPGAPDCDSLWKVLEEERNMSSKIPVDRFSDSIGIGLDQDLKPKHGNFLDNTADFDNSFFKISPREATSMDPQQRLFLHAAYQALENSGYVSGTTPSTQPDRVGCYVGVATDDYMLNLREHKDVYYSSGTLRSFISGRLSYFMKLGGPSLVVDTACSSSTVAIHIAHRALLSKDCDTAVVGGVNAITSPDMTMGLDKGHFLSPSGQCKPFDASADGYSRGEGCGVFVLKRLKDALSEHDNIIGIIRAVEVNQSGLAKSITHPHAPSQAALLEQLVDRAGVHPHHVNFVEAHGTGTQAGDPCELESIRQVFNVKRPHNNRLHVSSVKANIGHLEAASGAASLAKVLLMFKHRSIPRLISLETLNPRIPSLVTDNLLISRKQVAWPQVDGQPLLAAINNFGAAGSNAAVLLEEHLVVARQDVQMPFVFGLSAKTPEALEKLKRTYVDWLGTKDGRSSRLLDISYTMTARRQIYCFRTAVVASSRDELSSQLLAAKAEEVMLHDEVRPIFVFSGQGGQHMGMGQELYERYRVFRETVDDCESALQAARFPGILKVFGSATDMKPMAVGDEIQAFQVALFVLEVGLARLWMSWGIKPCAVIGHSLGEYAALVIAGVLPLKAALTIVLNRAKLMVELCPPNTSGMLAINLPSAIVMEQLSLDPTFRAISVSCINSPADTVVGGPLDDIRLLKENLDSRQLCKTTLLPVPFAYHTEMMLPICSKLAEITRRVQINPPTIPVVLNVSGDVLAPGQNLRPEYFVKHCIAPVQLDRSIKTLASQLGFEGAKTWIEIGPHPSILPMIKLNQSATVEDVFLPSMRRGQGTQLTLSTSLRKLYQEYLPLDWRAVFADTDAHCIDLPSYPFDKKRFFVPYYAPKATAPSEIPGTNWKLLGRITQQQDTFSVFEIPIEHLESLMRGHVVAGMPLCSASTYIELAMASLNTRHAMDGQGLISLRDLQFTSPLVYDVAKNKTVATRIEGHVTSGSLLISSRTGDGVDYEHFKARFHLEPMGKVGNDLASAWEEIRKRIEVITALTPPPESFSTRTLYEVIFQRVVQYSPEYQTLQTITMTSDHMEACGILQLPPSHEREGYVISPVFVDTLLHIAGFVVNMHSGKDAFICNETEEVLLVPEFVDASKPYRVYCKCTWQDTETMIADSYAVELEGESRVVSFLRGMQFRKVRMEGLRKNLALAAGKPPQYSRIRSATVLDRPRASGRARSSTITTMAPPKIVLPSIEAQVRGIVTSACGLDSDSELIGTTNLKDLGVDSLMFIEISMRLRKTLQLQTTQGLSSCETVGDIVLLATKRMHGGTAGIIDTPPASPTTTFSLDTGRLPTVFEG